MAPSQVCFQALRRARWVANAMQPQDTTTTQSITTAQLCAGSESGLTRLPETAAITMSVQPCTPAAVPAWVGRKV